MKFFATILVSFVLSSFLSQVALAKIIFCYWPNWAVYRDGCGLDVIKSVANKCTHIGYSFIGVNTDGTLKSTDNYADIDKGALAQFRTLKGLNGSPKLMAVVGGASLSVQAMKTIAANPSLRTKFANNLKQYSIQYGFDGIDLDWEYPESHEKENFNALVADVKKVLSPAGLLLTAAVGPTKVHTDKSYNIAGLHANLDFILLMTYDLYGVWNGVAKNHAGFEGPGDSVKASVENWINAGVPKSKLVVGLPAYGRSFVTNGKNLPGAPISGPGASGPITQASGILGYQEICTSIKSGQIKRFWDDGQKGPYGIRGNEFIGFDDDQSIKIKADYVKSQGLGGLMLWSLENDDCKGECGQKFPLLNSINKHYNGNTDGSISTEPEKPKEEPKELPKENPKIETKPEKVPPTLNAPFKCPSDGLHRNPLNCGQFYQCYNDNSALMDCPAGLKYNPNGFCDYAANVSC